MKSLLTVVVAAGLVFGTHSFSVVAAETNVASIRIVAHQGLHGNGVPGNTVEAIAAAYSNGWMAVETDFWRLKDGSFACMHDPKSGARLKKPYRIPNLDEVLACVPTNGVLQCEIKGGYGEAYATEFMAAVRRAGLGPRQITVSSANSKNLADFHRRYPEYRTIWLLPIKTDFDKETEEIIGVAKAAGIFALCPNGMRARNRTFRREHADAMRANGFDVRLWGVHTPGDFDFAVEVGASAITCNYPAKLTAYANKRDGSTSSFLVATRDGGEACGVSVEAKGASAEYAADELRTYVKRLTGVGLIAATDATRRVVLASGDEALGDDGFSITVTDRELRIAGGKRGILFGVYEVLTRFGGVEWFSSWCEDVPRLERLSVPIGFHLVQKPAIPVREVFWTDVTAHPEFAARLRTNNRSWCRADPRMGGTALRFGGGLSNCHTFDRLVPPKRYFKDHPEYFSEVGGKRLGERTQLCLTNPDVLAIATSNVLEAIRKDPTATCYGVSQNDWYNFCTCAKCKAVDDEEDSHAGTMIRFVNRIADAVRAVAPDKTVETLAYQYTQTPPKHVRPRDNVMVCLCSIECDFSKPMTASRNAENIRFRDDIRKWGEMTKRLYVWDYTTNYENYQVPHPNVDSLQENVRFFRDSGVYFLFEQGVHRTYHGDLAELKAWLLAKWMWDPDLPAEPLVDRFCRGYYGAAAPFAREYVRRLHAFDHDEAKRPLKCFTALGGHESSVSDEFLDWADANWRRAEQAVADDPVRLYNVRTSAFPVDYVIFKRRFKRVNLAGGADFDAWKPAADRLAATFAEAERTGRAMSLCESGDKHAARWQVVTNALAGGVKRIGDGVSVWQEEDAFAFAGSKTAGYVVEDAAASGGKALWLNNDNYQWYTTYHLDEVAFAPGTDYVLSVRLRAAPTGKPGEVVQIGVYDPANAKGGGILSLRAKDIRAGYADYDVLTWKPSAGQMIYVAPGHFDKKAQGRSAAHEGIWIDGFRLSKSGR